MVTSSSLTQGNVFQLQLDHGFRLLRFNPPLESGFRQHKLELGMQQLRMALMLGFLFGISFMILDYTLGGFEFSDPRVALRTAISQSLIVAMLGATFVAGLHRYLTGLAILVCLSIAACSLFITTVAESRGIGSPFTGYLVLTFYIYLFIGLRFWPALLTAGTVCIAVLVLSVLRGMPPVTILYNGIFLVFANLIGATGLYNLEYNQRKSYLEAKLLEKLATLDPLTGLVNREYFARHLAKTWAQCARDETPISLAMIDIDYFKTYNDSYGHQAGDRCLAEVASAIAAVCRRPLDLAGRYGGEEFIVVLPGASIDHAHLQLSELLSRIESLNIAHQSPIGKRLTVSAGLAHLLPHQTRRSVDGLLQLADEALYSAKRKGRNRVVVSREDREQSLETGIFHLTRTGELARSA